MGVLGSKLQAGYKTANTVRLNPNKDIGRHEKGGSFKPPPEGWFGCNLTISK